MASDKYVDITAAAGGDGTSITPWNDLIDLWVNGPSSGTLNPGDIVHIRTADSGGNLSVSTDGADRNMLEFGTLSEPVIWRFDTGVKWAESGVFTISTTDANQITFSEYNIWEGNNKNGKFSWDYTSHGAYWMYLTKRNVFYDIEFEYGAVNGKAAYIYNPLYGQAIFINCLVDMKGLYSSYGLFKARNYGGQLVFINTWFDANGKSNTAELIACASIGGKIMVRGGGLLNPGTSNRLFQGTLSSTYYNETSNIIGFDTAGATLDINDSGNPEAYSEVSVSGFGDSYDFYFANDLGSIKWEKGQSYPTLNATLPDGTSWALRCLNSTSSRCHMTHPFVENKLSKYISSAGVKTVTVELLICDQITTPTNRDFFIDVYFYNVDDKPVFNTSRVALSPSTLTASSETWSTTSYNGDTYTAYKIELTTTESVKAGTELIVYVGSGRSQVSSDDYYFVCPDFGVS